MQLLKFAGLTLYLGLLCLHLRAQATDSIKVLIIYGSKPAKQYRDVERKWFGGMRGGHVALQFGPDAVLNFHSTKYPCHIIAATRSSHYHARFDVRSVAASWNIFPPHDHVVDSLQRGEIVIPITPRQRQILDSLITAYTAQAPYDYAVAGMRCASATYEILGQIGVLQKHRHFNWLRILLPRRVRTILYKTAVENKAQGWVARRYTGYTKRVWEHDRVDRHILQQITVGANKGGAAPVASN